MLKPNQVNHITYKNKKDETTERDIIVFSEPSDNVLSIDVTDDEGDYVERLLSLVAEYNEYLALQKSTQFNFEDFVEQTTSESIGTVKWRALNKEKISISE